MAYYGTDDYGIVHFPFNFQFVRLNTLLDARDFKNEIYHWLDNMPKGATPNWMVRISFIRQSSKQRKCTNFFCFIRSQAENHDNLRLGSRLCEEYMDIVTVTIMTLPGVACIYYGEEIGMVNGQVRKDQRQDPNNDGWSGKTRDGERLPMQWDNSMNAGNTQLSICTYILCNTRSHLCETR